MRGCVESEREEHAGLEFRLVVGEIHRRKGRDDRVLREDAERDDGARHQHAARRVALCQLLVHVSEAREASEEARREEDADGPDDDAEEDLGEPEEE